MKNLGLTLITLSFLAGAYLTVLDALEVNWTYFIPVLVVGFVGVGLVQAGRRQHAQAEERVAENIALIAESLDNVVAKVERLNAEKTEMNPYDVRHEIDARLLDDLDAFVGARETIGHVYGLQAYADVMSHFAGGERYLNRVWSASADGYIDEVHAYLDKAQEQFEEARRKMRALESPAG